MSTNDKRNLDDQEIDLSQVIDKLGGFFNSINTFIFNIIRFILRNIIIMGILIMIGVGVGLYLDKTNKVYDNKIIVIPNFGSIDYLYSKIEFIQSKVNERDTVFLKSIGIKNPNKLSKIEVKPIVDIYKFVSAGSDKNFELLKLLSEDGDINKIVVDKITSKNYTYHLISFTTMKYCRDNEILEPLMNFLNSDKYYNRILNVEIQNLKIKMEADSGIIAQIDGFLSTFSNNLQGPKSSNMVYYNENTQLNDVIQTKNNLITEQGKLRMDLANIDKIIKENSRTTNIINKEFINGKLKFILPIIFISLYLFGLAFFNFYKKQAKKLVK